MWLINSIRIIMFRFWGVVIFLCFLFSPCLAETILSTFDIVKAACSCTDTTFKNIECNYKVGKDLHFIISGVGESDAGITFMKSSYEGDFYATFGIRHGCVIVKRGKKAQTTEITGPGSLMDFTFVSPKNGKVYRTWADCASAN